MTQFPLGFAFLFPFPWLLPRQRQLRGVDEAAKVTATTTEGNRDHNSEDESKMMM
jgi:hypothetical protein